MHVKSLVSPLALAVALSFTGGASAQTMMGVEIPPEDLPEVQNLCNSLAAEATDSLATTDAESIASDGDSDDGDGDDDAVDDGDDAADDGDDDAEDGQADPDPAAEDGAASDLDNALTTIDLDTITLEDCKAAGLVDTARVTAE